MPYLIVFLAFVFKHGYTSNILDVGYTRSRDRFEPCWCKYLSAQVLLDACLSLPVYWFFTPQNAIQLVLLEASVLILSCIMERKASYPWMIAMHLLAETFVLFLYMFTTYILFTG